MLKFMKWAAAMALGAVVLVGCSGGGATPEAKTEGGAPAATKTAKKIKIGVSVPAADHGWTAGVIYWAKEAMALYPDVEWVFKDAKDPNTQINDVETMVADGIDGLVILCTESAPLTPAAKKAKEAGVYIVNVDRGFLEPVADVFLEGDNTSFGRKSAEFVAKQMGGKGNLLILTGIPCTVDTARVEGAKEIFKANPGIKILDQQPGNWNQQKAFEVTQTLLLKHAQVDAIWCQDDDMALGVEKALKEAKRTDVKFILGGAGMKDIVKRVGDGDTMFPANITYPPSMIATGIQIAVSNLRDGNKDKIKNFMPKHIKIDVDLITKDNAKDYYFPDSIY